MMELKLFSEKNAKHKVLATIEVTPTEYVIRFQVHQLKENGSWNLEKKFGSDPRKNWELWTGDVVECFLRPEGQKFSDGRYLELQLNPAGEALILWVVKPRLVYYTPLEDHQFIRFEARQSDELFEGNFYIKKELFGPITSLSGNLHACLGTGEREYWALNFPDHTKLDFHRPEGFVKLI